MIFKVILKGIFRFLWKQVKKHESLLWEIWYRIKPHIGLIIHVHDFLLSISNSFFLFVILWYLIHKYFLGWKYYLVWFFWGLYCLYVYNFNFLIYFDHAWLAECLNTLFVWYITATPNRDLKSVDQKICMFVEDVLWFSWPSRLIRVCPDGTAVYPPICTVIYFLGVIIDKLYVKYVILGGDMCILIEDIKWVGEITGWF